jgi:hypothetical protein
MTKLTIPTVPGFSPAQVDAAAEALWKDAGSTFKHRPWTELPSSAKKGWWHRAAVALAAAYTAAVATNGNTSEGGKSA